MSFLIYKHTNKINGKVYIGQTCQEDPNNRWRNGAGYKTQNFYKAILKYGWENFEHEILEKDLSAEEVDTKEQYYISYYKANNPDYGQNLTSGGNYNKIVSEEAREKIKQSFTPEKREKYSKALKERWKNDKEFAEKATKARQSVEVAWHPIGELNPMYGTHRTGKEAARKRRVQCIETGEVFDTIVDAAKWSNNGKTSSKSHISDVCKGKRKTCGKHPITNEQLHWRQVDEEKEDK